MAIITRQDLMRDLAQSLKCEIEDVPGDLTDTQLEKALGYAKGTIGVQRSRGDLTIPSFKAGKSRRTPLSALISFKLEQIARQLDVVEVAA